MTGTVQKFYFHDASSTVVGTLPGSSSESATTPAGTAPGASTNRNMDSDPGVLQTSVLLGNGVGTNDNWFRRFVSQPLDAQAISAGTWTMRAGIKVASGFTTFHVSGCIYIWRPSTGTLVGTIADVVTTPIGNPAGTNETDSGIATLTASGSPVTTLAGDVLIFEFWGVSVDSNVPAHSRQCTIYYDGTTEGSTTSNAAYVNAPFALNVLGPGGSETIGELGSVSVSKAVAPGSGVVSESGSIAVGNIYLGSGHIAESQHLVVSEVPKGSGHIAEHAAASTSKGVVTDHAGIGESSAMQLYGLMLDVAGADYTGGVVSIQTTRHDDLVIAVLVYNAIGGLPTISDSAGLDWSLRGLVTNTGVTIVEWWAPCRAPTIVAVTMAVSGSSATATASVVFAVAGANLTSPFDPAVASPAKNSGTGTSDTVTITTSYRHDFLFSIFGTGPAAGWGVGSDVNMAESGITEAPGIFAQWNVTVLPQPSRVMSTGTGVSLNWAGLADAIRGFPGGQAGIGESGSVAIVTAFPTGSGHIGESGTIRTANGPQGGGGVAEAATLVVHNGPAGHGATGRVTLFGWGITELYGYRVERGR